ncbi:hypothetical protein Patl1_20213 [Pistacia atlantica]|uniref:Uncharacterized protein n=1 Tax=Pistacia atlantica TaxID=434234 RepID=A0ACC1BK48_9ROSI|nr:hypothetical protein Patl1_20213 [Pistacia atlantica]
MELKLGMSTQHLITRRLTCISPDGATIALGSEMSGGIKDVKTEDIIAIDTQSGVRIKTVVLMSHTLTLCLDPKALAKISGINYRDMVADNFTYSTRLEGIHNEM